MKKLLIVAGMALVAGAVLAEPVKALLVVQNHSRDRELIDLPSLTTHLSAALSGDLFSVIDPNDAIGEDLNRSAKGETMPLSSAIRLAENLEAQALITVSINTLTEESFGVPAMTKRLNVAMTIQVKRVPSGAAACQGLTLMLSSKKLTAAAFAQDKKTAYDTLMAQVCASAAEQFLAKPQVAKITWTDASQKVMVAFGCNYPGANVSIDGVSYGTAGTIGEAPLQVPVAPGIHNLMVSLPFAIPYKVKAKFMNNSSYMISFDLTDEGRRRVKDDAYFAELLDRAAKSGATDDFCRTERAKGYAKYLSSSHTRIAGMPQVLTKWNWGDANQSPELGLKPAQGDEHVESTEKILKKTAEQVERK